MAATKTEPKAKERVACECSKFSTQVNARYEDGVLVTDEVLTTGCTSTTVNTFAPGHDAKLKSFLIKSYLTYRGKCGREENGTRTERSALDFAQSHGFSLQVAAGIQNEINRESKKRQRRVLRVLAKELRESGESEETRAVMLALHGTREGDLPGHSAGYTFGSTETSFEDYRDNAMSWLRDASELTGEQIREADYKVAYEWFVWNR